MSAKRSLMSADSPVTSAGSIEKPTASRRTFLRGAGIGAGASVLGAAALASAPAPAWGATSPEPVPEDDGGEPDGTLVAYVSDVATGRISLLRDGHEVVVTDRALARRLARKAR
jgi:hypothetical protein